MESGLGRWLRGGAASLRVLWTSRGGVCLAGVAIVASLAWFVPVRGMHLLPDRGRAILAVAARPEPEIRRVAPADSVESQAAAAPVVEPPPAVEAAFRTDAPTSGPVRVGDRLIPAAGAPPQAPATREAMAAPEPAPGTAMLPPAVTPLIPPAALAPSRPNMVPDPRPPLPLETDLIPTGSPAANPAAQSAAPQPVTTTPTGKPSATDHHG